MFARCCLFLWVESHINPGPFHQHRPRASAKAATCQRSQGAATEGKQGAEELVALVAAWDRFYDVWLPMDWFKGKLRGKTDI